MRKAKEMGVYDRRPLAAKPQGVDSEQCVCCRPTSLAHCLPARRARISALPIALCLALVFAQPCESLPGQQHLGRDSGMPATPKTGLHENLLRRSAAADPSMLRGERRGEQDAEKDALSEECAQVDKSAHARR